MAEVDSVVWMLDKNAWLDMKNHPDGPEMALEIYRIALKLTVERFTSAMSYILISTRS